MINKLIRVLLAFLSILLVSMFSESHMLRYGLGLAISFFIFEPMFTKVFNRDLSK